MELVPYEPMTNNAPQRLSQGVSCGVYITADLEDIDWMIARFERWFAERNEVVQVDEGSTDKLGHGFVILEWEGCMIDPLFIAILRDEEKVIDYTMYQRTEEG